jgi:hypothetical protein
MFYNIHFIFLNYCKTFLLIHKFDIAAKWSIGH